MVKLFLLIFILLSFSYTCSESENEFETETIKTSGGDLNITFIGHGTLMFSYNNLIIHVDPVSRYGDYSKLPKADIILVTHEHGDHLDAELIATLKKEDTEILLTEICAEKLGFGTVMRNGDSTVVKSIEVSAVPAYNIQHKRESGAPFHPKGNGNGYVMNFGGKKVYVAGDTENIPEMSDLTNIDIAFLPMNLPYTMTPAMVAEAASRIQPGILYPYHFGSTETSKLTELLKKNKNMEIRIRELQ